MKNLKLLGVKIVLTFALIMLIPGPVHELLTPSIASWLLYFLLANYIVNTYIKDQQKKDEVCRCKKAEDKGN